MPILPQGKHCCGCSACFSACPHDSIAMTQDFEGFYYPEVNPTTCTECKQCEIACPTLPFLDFAPYNQVRKKSRFPYDVKSHSLDSRGIYVHFSWHKPSFYSKPLESSALDSRVDCHADKSARNDRSYTAQNPNNSAQDSKIVELESGLFKACKEYKTSDLSTPQGAEIHDSSPQAESINSFPPPPVLPST